MMSKFIIEKGVCTGVVLDLNTQPNTLEHHHLRVVLGVR